jgi:hypothetical protein
MNVFLDKPSLELAKAAEEKFNDENDLLERTLSELFGLYPTNEDPRHVLLKVVAVNSLYYTNIYAVQAVASHILKHASEIDDALGNNCIEIVDRVAKVEIKDKTYNFFSFASKYCHWHKPEFYPIYDSRVERCLAHHQKRSPLTSWTHSDHWDYPRFHRIICEFRSVHGLDALSFKQLDEMLYTEGEKLMKPLA